MSRRGGLHANDQRAPPPLNCLASLHPPLAQDTMSESRTFTPEQLEPLTQAIGPPLGGIPMPRPGVLRIVPIGDAMEVALRRAEHLAGVSHALAASIDEAGVRNTVRRLTLPRADVWCIVDVVESSGAIRRLPIAHRDPVKAPLFRELERQWLTDAGTMPTADNSGHSAHSDVPTPIARGSGPRVIRAAHGDDNRRLLERIGFGALLAVPLVARGRIQGAITFVSGPDSAPFSPGDVGLAVDLGTRCAVALDNARQHRELDTARLAAETANRSKTQFLQNMSHELRTPLNAIGGFMQVMDMGLMGPVTDEQRTALGRVKANQEHLLMLITEVLSFTSLTTGRLNCASAPVSIREQVQAVTEMLGGMAADRGLPLASPDYLPDVTAWADEGRVRQILVNLVTNAVKYTKQGAGAIRVTWGLDGKRVLVTVADMGPGIPAARLESIFEPFVQLIAGEGTRRGGVGLGLAISRDLARAMGGDVTIESVMGIGSRFTLSLPVARPSDLSAS